MISPLSAMYRSPSGFFTRTVKELLRSSRLRHAARFPRSMPDCDVLERRLLLTTQHQYEAEELHVAGNTQPIFGGADMTVTGYLRNNEVDEYSFFAFAGQEITTVIDPPPPIGSLTFNAVREAQVGFYSGGNRVGGLTAIGQTLGGIRIASNDPELPMRITVAGSEGSLLTSATYEYTATNTTIEIRGPLDATTDYTEPDGVDVVLENAGTDMTTVSAVDVRFDLSNDTGIQTSELLNNVPNGPLWRLQLDVFEPVLELLNPSGDVVATGEGYADFFTSEAAEISHIAEVGGIWTVRVTNKSADPAEDVREVLRMYDLNVLRGGDMILDLHASTQWFGGGSGDVSFEIQGADLRWHSEAAEVTLDTDPATGIFRVNGIDIVPANQLSGRSVIGDDGEPILLSGISVKGGGGNDTIDASGMNPDLLGAVALGLNGGGGDDLILGSTTSVEIGGGAGTDTFVLHSDQDLTATDSRVWWENSDLNNFAALESIEVIELHGDEESNWLDADTSSAVKARLFGYGGSDYLYGGEGDDFLDGGEGHDNLNGNLGADILLGGPGHDSLRGNGTNALGDAAADSADGGEGWDTIEWTLGDAYGLLTGGVDAEGDDRDTLLIEGKTTNLDITGSLPVGGPPQLAIDRDDKSATALGFERLQLYLEDYDRDPDDAAPAQNVNIIEPYGVAVLDIETDGGSDNVNVVAADFDAGEAFVYVSTGGGDDEITLAGPGAVGDSLEVDIHAGDGDDTIRLIAATDSVGPIFVGVNGGDNTDTIIIDGTDQADQIFITQLEGDPNSADINSPDDIEPGQYTPELEALADSSANQDLRRHDQFLVHVNHSIVEIDLEDASGKLIINGLEGADTIAGRLDSFETGLALQRITVNGGDELDDQGNDLPGDTIDLSGVVLAAVPEDPGPPPIPTLVINGGGGNDHLTGRFAADKLDGGDGTDQCLNAFTQVNCEADVTVVAEYDNDAAIGVFGAYIPAVALLNTFTVNVPGADAAAAVTYDIDNGRWTGTADRLSDTSEEWTFTFDIGNLTTSPLSGRQSFPIDVLVNDNQAFTGTLKTADVDFRVDVRPVSVGPTPQGVGNWIPFQNIRFVDGLAGSLEYRVQADLPLFAQATVPNPYANALQLIRRNNSTDDRSNLYDQLSFITEVDADTRESAVFTLPNSSFGNTDNTTNETSDWGLYLSAKESTIVVSSGFRSAVVEDTPDWLGDATSVTRKFVTTQDVLPDSGEQSVAERLWYAFNKDAEAGDFTTATAGEHFGGYVLEAELGIIKELNSTLAGFFPASVTSTKIFDDLMDLIPETSVELKPRVTAYAKLDASGSNVAVLQADHFAVKVTFAGVELLDTAYDFKHINVAANLNSITLDLGTPQENDSDIVISTDRIVAENLPKSVQLVAQDPDDPNDPFPLLKIPTPVPWLNASVAGGAELALNDAGYQVSLGLKRVGGGLSLVQEDTWLSVDAKTTAAAIGQLNLGIGLLGIDLVGLAATAKLEGKFAGKAVVNFDASGTPDYNKRRSNLSVDWDWSFDVQTHTFVDWLNDKIDFVEDQIDSGEKQLNNTLTSLNQAVEDVEDDVEKFNKTTEKWWLYEGEESKVSDESPENEVTGSGTVTGMYGSVVPVKGASFNLLGPGQPTEGQVAGLNLAGELPRNTQRTSFQYLVTAAEESLTSGTHRLLVMGIDPAEDTEVILNEIDLSTAAIAAGDVPTGFLSTWIPVDISLDSLDAALELQFRLISDGTQSVAVAIDEIGLETTVPELGLSAVRGALETDTLTFEQGAAHVNLTNMGREILDVSTIEVVGDFTIANPVDSVTYLTGNEFAYPLLISADNPDVSATGLLRITSNDPANPVKEIQLIADRVVRPDLRGVAFNVLTDHVKSGVAEISFEIENSGAAAAGPFEVGFVWSPNDVFGDADDILIEGETVTINELAAATSTAQTVTIHVDRSWLYANSLLVSPPSPAGTTSQEASHVGIVIDVTSVIDESDETNNSGRGYLVDQDDVTYFAWDLDGNGVVTPIEALDSVRAIGTNAEANDFDGNGVVTPLEAVSVLQRIGYRRNDAVLEVPENLQQGSAASLSAPLASVAAPPIAATTLALPPDDDTDSLFEGGELTVANEHVISVEDQAPLLDQEFSSGTDWLSII